MEKSTRYLIDIHEQSLKHAFPRASAVGVCDPRVICPCWMWLGKYHLFFPPVLRGSLCLNVNYQSIHHSRTKEHGGGGRFCLPDSLGSDFLVSFPPGTIQAPIKDSQQLLHIYGLLSPLLVHWEPSPWKMPDIYSTNTHVALHVKAFHSILLAPF